MLSIDIYSRVPIYQQIIDGIQNNISLGLFKEGEQIPSIRELSVEVGTNPNTVSKSYLELERLGILSAAVGKGYFVAAGATERIRSMTVTAEQKNLLDAAEKLAKASISEDEILSWIHQVYQNHTQKENEK